MSTEPRRFNCMIPANGAVAAHNMVYYVWGNENAKETIFCVHGLTRNARDFDFLAAALCDRYRVVAPDIAGRGQSDYLADSMAYNYGTYVYDIAVLAQTLNLSNLHWIGTSMGGIIGMMLCNTMPTLIRSLTLNDIGCLLPASGLERILEYVGRNTIFNSREEAEAAFRYNLQSFGVKDEAHWQHLFYHSLIEDNGKIRLAYDPAIKDAFTMLEKIEDIDLWNLWEGIKQKPVLLIRGQESDILTKNTALTMQQKHDELTLCEAENTGHAPMLMEDKQTALIREWVDCT